MSDLEDSKAAEVLEARARARGVTDPAGEELLMDVFRRLEAQGVLEIKDD